MKQKLALLIVVALLVSSCATLAAFQKNERAQLQAAQITFTGLVLELATLRAQGKFDIQTADKITLGIKAGNGLLDRWATALKNNGTLIGSGSNILTEFDAVISLLSSAKKGVK